MFARKVSACQINVIMVTLLVVLLSACDTGGSASTGSFNSGSGNNPPTLSSSSNAGNSGGTIQNSGNSQNSGGESIVASSSSGDLPRLTSKPQPIASNFMGCPAIGDGGDPELNLHKNRTDAQPWYPVPINKILNLPFPASIGGQKRSNWSARDRAEVAQYEGIPIQLEGWLAGAKQQGPESTNCHSTDDVDNHLWLVDNPSKDRSQSVVVEITPRIRALHPGWAFERVQPLVDGATKIRISGWLMMDQEHPDQIGKTRGTIWEVHPIMAIDVLRGSNWIPLDSGRVVSSGPSANNKAAPLPTQFANLPPTEGEQEEAASLNTPTPRPKGAISQGKSSASGPIYIKDINFNGSAGQSEPDEYVEISNRGNTAVSLDGWTLRDVYGGEEFTWHNFTLGPGQNIRVYTNELHPDTGGFSFGSRNAIWRNKGDAAELLDNRGMVVSSFAFGDKR